MDDHDSDEWATDDRRLRLIEWISARNGCAYIYGAKGEVLPPEAWLDIGLEVPPCREVGDCSWLATAAIKAMGGPDWLHTHRARDLFAVLQPIHPLHAAPGDLVFYGQPDQVSHVMFVVDEGKVYGACGGTSYTRTLADAHKVGARVRHRSSALYRPDVRGYRAFPFPPKKEIRDA